MFNFSEVAAFAKFFLNGKIINGTAFGMKAQNDLENKPVLWTVKLICSQNRVYSGTTCPPHRFHKHGVKKLFLHFNSLRYFMVYKIHILRHKTLKVQKEEADRNGGTFLARLFNRILEEYVWIISFQENSDQKFKQLKEFRDLCK